MNRQSAFLKNTALLLAGIAVALLLGEAVLALFLPQGKLNIVAENIFFVKHDSELGWVNRPGAEGDWKPNPDAPAVHVRINSRGFRGAALPHETPPERKRMLILGDSVGFGYGVEEAQAFTTTFGAMLSDTFEVINSSVVGWGTDQELLFLARDGHRYRPDIVLVGFTPGDVQDNMSSFMLNYPKPYFILTEEGLILQGIPVPETMHVGETLLRDSKAVRFIYEHSNLARLVMNAFYEDRLKLDRIEVTSRGEGHQLTAALLGAIRRECSSIGCRVVVLLLPNGKWLDESVRTGSRQGFIPMMISMLDGMGIPYIDPYPALYEARKRGEVLFLPGDPVHPNARGHEILAEEAAKAIAGMK